MATLLSICTEALQSDGRFDVPSTIVGNTDPTAVQLLALANRTGRILANDYSWQKLETSYTFSTVASTASYALPSDFHHFLNLTYWDRSNYRQMVGPVSAAYWQMLQSGNFASAGINKYFRIYGDLFYIYPTPADVATIAYQYQSSYFVSGKAAFSLDADVPLLDFDLFILGIRYRFLAAKGLPYAEEKDEYMRRLASLQEKDGGKNVISFGGAVIDLSRDGLPDVGFGA